MITTIVALLAIVLAVPAFASVLGSPEGMEVRETDKTYAELLSALKEAVAAEKMGVVTEAGPTEAAAQRGETIPGNRVVGVFRNDFAVDLIRAAPAAMIEAPIRIMVMEEPDGTATLAWKRPSVVLAPYGEAEAITRIGVELDAIFERIAARAAE